MDQKKLKLIASHLIQKSAAGPRSVEQAIKEMEDDITSLKDLEKASGAFFQGSSAYNHAFTGIAEEHQKLGLKAAEIGGPDGFIVPKGSGSIFQHEMAVRYWLQAGRARLEFLKEFKGFDEVPRSKENPDIDEEALKSAGLDPKQYLKRRKEVDAIIHRADIMSESLGVNTKGY